MGAAALVAWGLGVAPPATAALFMGTAYAVHGLVCRAFQYFIHGQAPWIQWCASLVSRVISFAATRAACAALGVFLAWETIAMIACGSLACIALLTLVLEQRVVIL